MTAKIRQMSPGKNLISLKCIISHHDIPALPNGPCRQYYIYRPVFHRRARTLLPVGNCRKENPVRYRILGCFSFQCPKDGYQRKGLRLPRILPWSLGSHWGTWSLIRYLTEARINRIPFRVPQVIAHPLCFRPRRKPPLPNTGSPVDEGELRRQFPANLSDKPVWITSDLVFLGEIPRKFAFEQTDSGKRMIILPDGTMITDQLMDDSALAYRSSTGLVIITGCSHAGICNITEYAREVFGERRIIDIIGGLHLLEPSSEQLVGTCNYLQDLAPRAVHVCHCTSLQAKIALSRYCPVQETGVGLRLEY